MKEGERVIGNAKDYYYGRSGTIVASFNNMAKVFFDIQRKHLNADFNEIDMAFWYYESELRKEKHYVSSK